MLTPTSPLTLARTLVLTSKLFDPYEYHVDLCNESSSYDRPSILQGKNFTVEHHTQTFQPFFSHLLCLQASLTSTILDHFHWAWPCLRVTRLARRKTYWLHFLEYFSTDQDEIQCGIEAIHTEHTDTIFSEILWNKANIYWFTDCVKRL